MKKLEDVFMMDTCVVELPFARAWVKSVHICDFVLACDCKGNVWCRQVKGHGIDEQADMSHTVASLLTRGIIKM